MITFLHGTVVSVTEKRLVLEVGGVGFQVGISALDSVNMPAQGEDVTIYTYMSVREDGISLYGFLSEDDLDIFRLMIGVSGIGPKVALGILSALTGDDVRMAILSDDAKTIAKAPGIGAKGAQKLILELRDKISATDMLEKLSSGGSNTAANAAFEAAREEAVQVMTALGFSRSEAVRMIRNADIREDMDADEILTAAMKQR